MKADPGAISQFVVKNWPRALAALKELDTFLKAHPGVPTWLRGRLDDIRRRIDAVQKRRGDAARIRGMLDIIRTESRELAAHEGHRSATDPAAWIRRADTIDHRVRLAEVQDRPEQRRTLARLKAEADLLLADLIDATADVPSGLESEQPDGPEDEPEAR